jgi:hypothetical protein
MPRWGLALAGLLVAACQSVAAPTAPLTGSWGGQHIGLTLTAEGGRLDYDCAAGTIDPPLSLDRDSWFHARGTHSPGQGGPDRIGYEPPRLPATYEGWVRGDRMTLRVRVPSTGAELGPFTLRRGAEPILVRCL